jgi:agarase
LLMAAWTSLAIGAKYDLSKATQSHLERDWAFTSMSWFFRDGALRDTGTARSHAVLQKELRAEDAWVEAEVMVQGRTGDGWKVAGVSLYQDVRHYWHLALVESPGEAGGRRFVELRLMNDDRWGAEERPSIYKTLKNGGEWRYGIRYRLRLEKQGMSLKGLVRDAAGVVIADIECQATPEALVRIFPSVDNGGFNTSFLKLKLSKKFSAEQLRRDVLYRGNAGFFKTTTDNGVNWLLRADGDKFLSLGCELVKYREIWCQALGYSPYHRTSEKLFGSESLWARDVAGKLRFWGFNTVGQSEMPEEIVRRGLAYAPILRLGQMFSDHSAIVPKTFWTGFPDVFDPRYERYCRMAAENKCRPWRDDPDLLGYYIDNELEWFGKDGKPWSLFTSAMRLGPGSRAKLAAVELLRKRHGRIDGFNSSWGTGLKTWEALAETSLVLVPNNAAAIDDAEAYISRCAEEYFRIATAAIRRADPNHLVLGARFAWLAPEPAWEAAGRHCDIVSFNCYPRVDMLSGDIPGLRDSLENRYKLCAKPLLISEWGFPALDAGLPSTRGAGMRVDDQSQRAYCAARLQEEFFSLPFVVGTSWFMWADEPALGVTDSFPENSNYGLVNVGHQPYLRLTSALGSVNGAAAEIHRGAGRPWRSGMLRAALFRKHRAAARYEKPAVRMRHGRLEVDNGEVRLVLTPGKSAGIDSILWHGISMGSYHPLVFQRRGGDGWLAPDKITGFTIEDFPGNGRVLHFSAEFVPRDTAWAAFSVKFRLILPPQGSWFLAEMLEISSLGPTPWLLEGYYHYIPSGILDGPRGDRPNTPTVPNYWLRRGGWFDEKAGLHFGALALEDAGWAFQPYIDSLGGQHPDIFRTVKRQMAKGEGYRTQNGPVVIYMGREDRSNHPWTTAAFQAWDWLKTMENREKP